MLLRCAVVWCGLVVLAVLNGALRIGVLIPRIGEAAGHVASTLLLCVAIAVTAWWTVTWIRPARSGEALWVGALWLVLTLGFEFGFGHFVAGKSWGELLADYDVLRGRVWVLVLITTLTAPYLAARARRLF